MSTDFSVESPTKNILSILSVCEPSIKPLVKILRERGWETISSCDGHGIREAANVVVLLRNREDLHKLQYLDSFPGVFINIIDYRIFGEKDKFYNLAASYMTSEDYYVAEIRIGYNLTRTFYYGFIFNKIFKNFMLKILCMWMNKTLPTFL